MSVSATVSPERGSRPEGLVLSDKYRLGAEIGSGSAGTVYVAENLAIQRRVAIKVLDAALAKTPEAVARFHREAQAAGRLQHPHIVDVLDLGTTDDGVPFIVMEYLEGTTLRELLVAEGRLEVPRAIDIALQTLDVLRAAHAEGIIHRDLKPENLFLTRRGRRGDFVKVLDFGVAKFSEPGAGNLTNQGMTVGTPNYMSPEQVRGRELDSRSDMYSVGVVIWEMLAGRLPHEGDNENERMIAIATKDPPTLAEVRPDLDPKLSTILARAMQRDPATRTASARELAAALEPFGAALEIDVGDDVVSLPPRAVPALDEGFVPAAERDGSDTDREGRPAVLSQRNIETEAVATRSVSIPRERRRSPLVAVSVIVLIGAAIALALALGRTGAAGAPERTTVRAVPLVPPLPPPDAVVHRPTVVAPATGSAPAPQPAPTPERVTIDVQANVVGAFVTLDGRPLGQTPLVRDVEFEAGEHDLEVSADDHAPSLTRVRLDAPVHVRVELGPLEDDARPPRRGRPPTKGTRPTGKEGTFDPFAAH